MASAGGCGDINDYLKVRNVPCAPESVICPVFPMNCLAKIPLHPPTRTMPPPSSSSLLSCNSHKNEHHSPRLGSLARRRSPPSENASRTRRLAAGQSRHSRTSRCTGEFHHWELQNQIPRIPGPIPSSSLQENTFAIIGSARRERWAWNSFATRGCPSKHKKPIAPYTRHVHLTHKR